jgi:hypothetical protein
MALSSRVHPFVQAMDVWIRHWDWRIYSLCLCSYTQTVVEGIELAITLSKILDLEGQEFNRLFTNEHVTWIRLARQARDLVQAQMPEGHSPHIDDIAQILVPLIGMVPELKRHLGEKKIRAKFWTEYFADYILFRIYQPRLQEGEAQ